jgi:3-dehydro-4-phosphotetronate decarboxylase
MSESRLREEIAAFGKSLFDRGLSGGSSGNISVRLDDGWLMTPTGSSLGNPDRYAGFRRRTDQGGLFASGNV